MGTFFLIDRGAMLTVVVYRPCLFNLEIILKLFSDPECYHDFCADVGAVQ